MRHARRVTRPVLSREERDALLGRDVSATLAFVDTHGHPRIVPCWFFWDGMAFYVSSLADKFHVRCLGRDARASICVEVEEVLPGRGRSNRQVKALGRVEILSDAAGEWTGRIRARYLQAAALPDAALVALGERVVLRLAPERLSAHGGGIEVEDERDN